MPWWRPLPAAGVGLGATVVPFWIDTGLVLVPWLFLLLYTVGVVALGISVWGAVVHGLRSVRVRLSSRGRPARWAWTTLEALVIAAVSCATVLVASFSLLVALDHADNRTVTAGGERYWARTSGFLDPVTYYHRAHGPFLMERDGREIPALDDAAHGPARTGLPVPPDPGPTGEDVAPSDTSSSDGSLDAGRCLPVSPQAPPVVTTGNLALYGRHIVCLYTRGSDGSWQATSVVDDSGDPYSLFVLDGLQVAGTGHGWGGEVALSRDDGATWEPVALPAELGKDPASHFLQDAEVVAGVVRLRVGYPDWVRSTEGSPVEGEWVESADDGLTWTVP